MTLRNCTLAIGLLVSGYIVAQTEVATPQKKEITHEVKIPEYINSENPKRDYVLYQIALMDYAVKYRSFPELNRSLDHSQLDKEIKRWNKANQDISADLAVDSYIAYLRYLKDSENKALLYPAKPKMIHTGNLRKDELNYKKAMNEWSINHPDYPSFINTGDAKKDNNTFRLAKLAFYDKYIKPQTH